MTKQNVGYIIPINKQEGEKTLTKLGEVIKKSGIRQIDIADVLKMDWSNFNKYINNPKKIKKMNLNNAIKLAGILNISLEELYKMGDCE